MKKVLFETHHLYYWPNFLPVIFELLKRKDYVINVSMPRRSTMKQDDILAAECKKLNIQFISSMTEESRIDKILKEAFDIIVVGNVGQLNKIILPKAIAVMVYHGIGLKQSYYNDIDDRINIRAVESLARMNELKGYGHKNLVLTGFTKLDRLQNIPDISVKNIVDKLQLNPNKKTILYAPSFYPTSIEKICPFLSELSQDHNIIIKLHGFSWEQRKYHYQNILCSELSKNNPDIHLLPNEEFDIIPFYLIANILITDISSTMFEYLPLNRPIIQAECYSLKLKHRLFSRRFWKKMDIKRHDCVDFTYKISEPDDLLSRVYYALDNQNEMSDKRKTACKDHLFKNDGLASSRLVDAIEKY